MTRGVPLPLNTWQCKTREFGCGEIQARSEQQAWPALQIVKLFWYPFLNAGNGCRP